MAKGSGLRNVLAALDRHGSKTKSHGGYHTSQCPVHGDRTASLSVSQGDKGARLKCHAGCQVVDIIAALDLSWPEIFDNGGQMTDEDRGLAADLWMPCQKNGCGGHKAAEYRYTDEVGNLLYAVARCSRKGNGCAHAFAQWIPDHAKKFGKKWGLPNTVRRVIYNLPRVIEAAKAGRRIWLMEGEKDADRMKADFPDEVATTIASGAGASKWRPEFTRYFQGASEVVIVADCDKAGLEYAEEVFRHLSKIVKRVRVVCTPLMEDGSDFSDHRDYGFGLDEFEIIPFEPIAKRPRMVIEVQETDREKPVVFKGFSQEQVERSLVGSILKFGHAYEVAEVDFITDRRLKIAVRAAARISGRGRTISPESIAIEIEEMGISTYDKAIPELLEIEKSAFSDTEKPKVAARILRERTLRSNVSYWLGAAQKRITNESIELDTLLTEMRMTLARHAEEFVGLDAYGEPVGDVFTGDIIEEVAMEEVERPTASNVRSLPTAEAREKRSGSAARSG